MYLSSFGLSCIKLQSQDRDTSVILDPFSADMGWKLPRLSSDIVCVSKNDEAHNAVDLVKSSTEDELFAITHPGEYEVKGIFVYGVDVSSDEKKPTTAYTVSIDNLFVGHFGALNRTLSEKELDALGRIDVLCIGVGGGDVASAKKAVEIINQIEPRIVVPIHYALPGLKKELSGLDVFLKEFGVKEAETVDKLKLLKKDLPAEETKVIVVSPQ